MNAPFIVSQYVGLPGDRVLFVAIDPNTGICCAGRESNDDAQYDAQALRAAWRLGHEARATQEPSMFEYKAKAMQNEGNGEWFVRLHKKLAGDPSDGGEFVGVCGANGIHEAEMVAECINAVIKGQNEDAMVLVKRMFDWSIMS